MNKKDEINANDAAINHEKVSYQLDADADTDALVADIFSEYDQVERPNCCQRTARHAVNGGLALSFSVQNSTLSMNTLFIAGEDWGWIVPGHELMNGYTWTIIGTGSVLFLANARSYYKLLEDFVGKSGTPGFAERWNNLSTQQKCKYVLGVYVSVGKTIISAISTYNFISSIIDSRLSAGVLTGVTALGNLGSNISVFLRPREVTTFMQVEKNMLMHHLQDVAGDKEKIRLMLDDANAIFIDNTISTPWKITAQIITAGYAFVNANLYLDNTYSFAKRRGAVDSTSLMVTSPLFWSLVAAVDIPMTIANYQGYYPLMKSLFKNKEQGRTRGCSGALNRLLGETAKDRLWNLLGIIGALVKTGASTISVVKVGMELFDAQTTAAKVPIVIAGVAGGAMVGIANLSIFNQPKNTYRPANRGPEDVHELYQLDRVERDGEVASLLDHTGGSRLTAEL